LIENVFEKIKMINEYGMEYWSARDLEDHFRDVTKMIKIAANPWPIISLK